MSIFVWNFSFVIFVNGSGFQTLLRIPGQIINHHCVSCITTITTITHDDISLPGSLLDVSDDGDGGSWTLAEPDSTLVYSYNHSYMQSKSGEGRPLHYSSGLEKKNGCESMNLETSGIHRLSPPFFRMWETEDMDERNLLYGGLAVWRTGRCCAYRTIPAAEHWTGFFHFPLVFLLC